MKKKVLFVAALFVGATTFAQDGLTSKKGEAFLSIIAPNECNFDCMGSFYLTSEHMWKKVETAEHKLK